MTRAVTGSPMIPSMSMRIGIGMTWRRLGTSVIPVAFVAALPLVQWCAVCADAAARACSADGAAAHAAAAACAGDAAGCGGHGTQEGQCPFESGSPRPFCVGAAMGGPGVRPHGPELPAPALQPMPLAAEPLALDPPRERPRADARAEARPPTAAWARVAPVRGPPSA